LTSITEIECDPEDIVKSNDKTVVLFYASWCTFSRRFLPIFEKYAKDKKQTFLRVKIDDDDSFCKKYGVYVVPTILFFENGRIKKRLYGVRGEGLTEKHLTEQGEES
jgi:thioredoxin 1